MKSIKYIIYIAVAGVLYLSSCKKEGTNIFNMFTDVEITFHDTGKTSITGYKQVMDGDTVSIAYTITSKKDMYAACLLEVGTSSPAKVDIKPSDRRSFSNVIKIKATRIGQTSYRVYPLDRQGVYMGDGGKLITIDVVNNMSYFNERIVRPADTTAKINPCFLSLTTGETFSYSEVAANPSLSSKIDCGIYGVFYPEVPASGSTAAIPEYHRYYLYSLSKSPSPFTVYDVAAWNKRTTLFSNRLTISSSDFGKLISASSLGTAAAKVTIDQSGPVEVANSAPAAGAPVPAIGTSCVYFKTPEGKFGIAYMSSTGRNHLTGRYLTFQIKIQQ
jgi:hypothetical protein